MKQVYSTLATLLLLMAMALPTSAQVNDDNEDGVVKLDANQSRYDYVPGQVLVKFNDGNAVKVTNARGRFRAVSNNRVNSLLQKYGAEEMEQLLPNATVSQNARRKTKAYNGETIVEQDLTQIYRIQLSEEHSTEAMQLMDELKQLDEVEYAEPNYRLYALEDTYIDGFSGGNPYAASQWYLEDYGVTDL